MNSKEALFQALCEELRPVGRETATKEEILDLAKRMNYSPGTAIGLMNQMETSGKDYIVKQENVKENVGAPEPGQISYVPKKSTTYVPWGHFDDLKSIIESKMFFPVFITGLSGNGKTFMVEQVCATLGREFVRIQITPETDEDDLIGGFRLVNGETVFSKGPVIRAMESGSILLIDEIDRGSNKLMALQGILEGNPVLIKKTGELVAPAPGFNIIGTANTKGRGSDDGKFIAAAIIDEAFLERFNLTFEQDYPPMEVEKKILERHAKHFNVENADAYIKVLLRWVKNIRDTYKNGGLDDVISTRRLCHIIQTYSIFKNREKAVALCLARFDDDSRSAMFDLYKKVDDIVDTAADNKTSGTKGNAKRVNPFA